MAPELDPVWVRHRRQTAEALRSGDREALHELYADLGEDLASEVDDVPPLLSYPETAPAVAKLVRADPGELVLDVGCGPNPAVSLAVADLCGAVVVGVDISHGMVRLARRVADRRGARFLGVVADVEQLPFRDASFATVVSDDTIEHVPDDREAVAEMVRVAAPSRRVVIATPNRYRLDVLWRRLRDLLRGRLRPASHYYAADSHLREYSWRELDDLVATCATRVAWSPVPWPGGWVARLASWLTTLPGLRRLSRVLVFALRRPCRPPR